ncbi:HPF/RaiA family ribosome-associated protein [Alteromonas sp. 14N.309.X.WAT.G.H12]|uniref:HPF/RaiA family ribosome-associated protein n=1 Tax=Alteromonas sp. 14N.309.X.WAT.G.H12 TaxID=3120824 RepID=UPI002FD067C5
MLHEITTQGIGLPVTAAIQEQVDKKLLAFANRYDAIIVKVSFSVKGKNTHVLIEYRDNLCLRTVKKTGDSFYSVLKSAAKSLRQTVTEAHQKCVDQKRKKVIFEPQEAA